MPSTVKRKARTPRSQNGCQRCKAKKIKCDESTPACQACRTVGVDCPGFVPQIRWSRKHEKFFRPTKQQAPSRSDSDKLIKQTPDQRPNGAEDSASSTLPAFEEPTGRNPAGRMPSLGDDPSTNLNLSDWFNLEMGRWDDLSFSNIAMMDQSFAMNMPLSFDEPPQQCTSLSSLPSSLAIAVPEELQSDSDVVSNVQHIGNLPNQTPWTEPMSSQSQEIPAANSLLGTFYRLSSPSPTPQFSDEHLVRHYFNEICSLYSCFDSLLNPFRHLVRDMWQSSKTIHLSIQSMAIAHLANHYLYMAPLGLVKRSQAWKSLQLDLRLLRAGKLPLEQLLLSLLLLGLSSAWHQPSNLGLPYLWIARNLTQTYLRNSQSDQPHTTIKNEKFFLDALMYWEMLVTFVDPVPMMVFPGYGTPSPQLPIEPEPKVPHPWTGITTEVHFALAEIGRVLRRRRNDASLVQTGQLGNKSQSHDDKHWATWLERFLQSIRIPEPGAILDYADENTPPSALVNSADAYRNIGLIEIYKAFPSCVESHFEKEGRFPAVCGKEFSVPFNGLSYLDALHSWVCVIAIYTLELLKDINISSAACRLQPLILISCAGQLCLPISQPVHDQLHETVHDEVAAARYFVEERMLALSRKYPQRQILQMLEIIKETWQRLDDGSENSHWLEVAHENGWQTMFG